MEGKKNDIGPYNEYHLFSELCKHTQKVYFHSKHYLLSGS